MCRRAAREQNGLHRLLRGDEHAGQQCPEQGVQKSWEGCAQEPAMCQACVHKACSHV